MENLFSILDTKYLRVNKLKVTLPKEETRTSFGNIIILNNNSPQGAIDFINNPFYNKMNLYNRIYMDSKYSLKLRSKLINKNLMSERLEVYKLYDSACQITPITILKNNKDHNLYYDISKYNEFFFNTLTDVNIKVKYEEYIKLLKNILSGPALTQFKRKMMFIYVPDISIEKIDSSNIAFNNPVNILFAVLKRDPELFKSLGDIDIVFADVDMTLKINPIKCDTETFSIFRTELKKLKSVKGILDESEESPSVNTVISKSQNDIDDMDDKNDIGDTDIDTKISDDLSDITGEITEDNDEDTENKEEKKHAPDEFDTLEILKSMDDRAFELEEKPNKIVLSPRDIELKNKQNDVVVSDFKLGDIHKVTGIETEIPHNDITNQVRTGNDEATKIKFDNFEKVYNEKFYHKDLCSIVDSFKDTSLPVFIREVKVENTSDTMNLKNTFTFNMEDVNRVRHTLKFDVPIFIDNEAMILNGNKKAFVKQRFLKPLVKTGPDTVQAVTNYNKIFMTRHGDVVESKFEKFKDMVRNNNYFSYIHGNCTRNNAKYKTSIEYDTLAKEFSMIKCKDPGNENTHHYLKETYLVAPVGKIKYGMKNLPDVMYFSSPRQLSELKGRVFLSPYAGISSIFIIDRADVMREYFRKYNDGKLNRFSYNTGYKEWGLPDNELTSPLNHVHITHNVPRFQEVENGESSGYIYEIDISGIKDKLELFNMNPNSNREVIYNGSEPLKINRVTPHTLKWEIKFGPENAKKHGDGIVESKDPENKKVTLIIELNQEKLKDRIITENKIVKQYNEIVGNGNTVIGQDLTNNVLWYINIKDEKIYVYGKKEPIGDSITDCILDRYEGKIDSQELSKYNSGSRYMFTRCMIMKKKIPLVLLLSYCEGLTTVLKKARIKHVFSDKRPKLEGRDRINKGIIQFANGYLVYDKYPLSNSLLLNGLTTVPVKTINYEDFDSKDTYVDIFDSLYNSRVLTNALDNFYDFMIDPVSKLILKDMKYPTEFVDLLLLGNEMLSDNNYEDETVMHNYRVRSNELVYAYAYRELTDAFIRYKMTSNNRNPVKISIPQDKILKNIMMSEIVEDTSKLSPILELEKSRSVTDKGPSGTNLDQAYTMKRRSFDESMVGIMAMSTSPDANVGVVRELTAEPNVINARGYFNTSKDNKQRDINLFSAAELITPLGVNRDDTIRTAMSSKQSKHIIPVSDASPVLISNGMEKTLPYHTGTDFSIVAKSDGQVVEIDEHNGMMIVKYVGLPKEDEIQIINIGKTMDKNGAGGFYLSNKLSYDLKKGQKFKKNDILAYNDKFYSKSHNEGVRFNIGVLVPVACMSTYASFEDDCFITKEFSDKASTEVVMPKSVVLGQNSNVEYIVKVGQEVRVNDPLILFDQSTEDASFNQLLANIGDDLKEEIQGLGKTPIKSHYAGVVEDIKIYCTVELDQLSPSLKKIVSDYYKNISNKKKLISKFRDKKIPTTDFLFNETDTKIETKDGKVKGVKVDEGVLIEIYIKYKDPVGIGDKIVHFAALKGIVGEVIPEGLEPFPISRPETKIATSFGSAALLARMVPSVIPTMFTNELIYQLKEQLRDIYAKDNPKYSRKK